MTTKPGPSPEYRKLLKGKISPDTYVQKVVKTVDRRLGKTTITGSAAPRRQGRS